MKKHSLFIKLLIAMLCLSSLGFANTSASVDSLFQVIKGDWYQNLHCSGMTGHCDSVYSETAYEISIVPGTDSINWTSYSDGNLISSSKYLLNKGISILNHQPHWMLSRGAMNILISCESGLTLDTGLDAYDGGGDVYSRLINEKAPTQSQIDSIASCISGDWYMVYNCNGFTGICDSIYSSVKNTITPIAGTDSVMWYGEDNGYIIYGKYKIIQTANNMRHRKSWMLTTEYAMPSPDGIHDLETIIGERLFIDCSNNHLGREDEAADAGYQLYAHSPRIETEEQKQIDSIADCMQGVWYNIYKCNLYTTNNPESQQCDSVYNANKTIFVHKQGSDSIQLVTYTDTCNYNTITYKVSEYSIDNETGTKKMTLSREQPIECYTAPCYPLTISSVIECRDSLLSITNNFIDGIGGIYARTAISNTSAVIETQNINLGFNVYPNPAISTIQIKGEKNIESIQIKDICGNTVASYKGNNNSLNIDNLLKGIYFLQINSEGKSQLLKLLKK